LPNLNALVAWTVDHRERATAYGLMATASFTGASLGQAGAGLLAAATGLSSVFLAAGGLLVAAFGWACFAIPKGAGQYRETVSSGEGPV